MPTSLLTTIRISSLVLFSLLLSCCSSKAHNTEHHMQQTKQSIYHTGDISVETLANKHQGFFHGGDFKFSAQDIAALKAIKEPVQITSYFGLWCHDSQRELPRMIELLKQVNNPNIQQSLIALDIYKKEPLNRQDKDKIEFTPTFIIYKNDQLMGRIVEKPEQDLAKDLLSIIKQK